MKVLLTGLAAGESPRWYGDRLWLSDMGANQVVAVDPDGSSEVVLDVPAMPMGLGWLPDGRMLIVSCRDGKLLRREPDGVAFPNGVAVTPDNSTLIIAESYASRLTAFDIAADGSLSNRRVWAALDGGVPDGICLDAENAIWSADVPNKRCVRVREGGAVLRTVELDRGCFACALGGPDRRTLFVTAAAWGNPAGLADQRTGQVVTVDVEVAGVGWP